MFKDKLTEIQWFSPSPERNAAVIKEITQGSAPGVNFYALLVTSSLVACFGLILNSTAVIIGAMLVSPLMSPIFGIALGLLRGDAPLIGQALKTEIGGIVLAVGASFLLGLLPLLAEATPEMLARTAPNLLDLLVAVLAGFAGAYAMLDERVSPALPGVAIATAIVPPLSTCGLCLAMGAYGGAAGAMILFLANLVSILVVSIVTFRIAGIGRYEKKPRSIRGAVKRYGITVAGFLIIAIVLTHTLVEVIEKRFVVASIRSVLTEEMAKITGDLDGFRHHSEKDVVYVLATVLSPRAFSPRRVTTMQELLAEKVKRPVKLVVRTIVSKDVAAVGSLLQIGAVNLNGVFYNSSIIPSEEKKRQAVQVLREQLQGEPGLEFTNVEYGHLNEIALVLVSVNAARSFRRSEIADLEVELRKAMKDSKLRLLLKISQAYYMERNGPILIDWTNTELAKPEERAAFPKLRQMVKAEVEKRHDTIVEAVHLNLEKKKWRILVRVTGASVLTVKQVKDLQKRLPEFLGHPLELNFWYTGNPIITASGYHSKNAFTEEILKERAVSLPRIFRK